MLETAAIDPHDLCMKARMKRHMQRMSLTGILRKWKRRLEAGAPVFRMVCAPLLFGGLGIRQPAYSTPKAQGEFGFHEPRFSGDGSAIG